ncbi:MAG TPA: hypothetical protein VN950_07455 [Terriglobales bacterium]|nr:hypothetical protein [Terriglobales bacterium]
MTASRMPVVAVTLLMAALGTPMAWTQSSTGTTRSQVKERARIALTPG